MRALREGERDFEEGRVITHEEMRAKWLGGDLLAKDPERRLREMEESLAAA